MMSFSPFKLENGLLFAGVFIAWRIWVRIKNNKSPLDAIRGPDGGLYVSGERNRLHTPLNAQERLDYYQVT